MKVYAIGGYDEVGKNMTAVEVDNEVVIFDMGLYLPKLLSYEEGDPRDLDAKALKRIGVIPDDKILEGKNVKAIVIGHAHLDHIGAAPHLAKKYNCPVLGTPYTLAFLESLLAERKIKLPNMVRMNPNSTFQISDNLKLELVHITHSIMQPAICVLHTKEGKLVYTLDFKLDN
ncbi:MBL fold metallo-hydrolase, partial [archaeon]|nr:MBL fold metallo-hydrolase [archaeon]